MKKFYIIMLLTCCIQYLPAQNANQHLSNLKSPTVINVYLKPGVDNTINIGSYAKAWKSIYTNGSIYMYGEKFIPHPGSNSNNTALGIKA